MKNRNKRHGFTLLELLTVLAVLSVVTTIGVQAFFKMTSVWADTSTGMEVNAKSVDIFNTIRQDFERVASAKRTGQSIQGVDRLETEKQINRHMPQDDRLIIPIYQRNQGDGPWEQLSVMYHIDRENGAPSLQRSFVQNDGSELKTGSSQLIGERILAMNIEYLNSENTWDKEWSRPESPAAVRVSLTIGLKNRPSKHVSREAVFPIHVK